MSNTKRPSLARKTTPRSEKARKQAMNEGLAVTIDGQKYTVLFGDLTALDTQALRRELGLSWIGLCRALSSDPDIDLIAGVAWLSRRVNGEPGLPYEAVASEMRYDTDADIDPVDDDEEPEDDETGPEG